MTTPSNRPDWPSIPYAEWRDSLETLQLWTQIVGKIRLIQTPWVNHSWHSALHVSARGLTTSLIALPERSIEIEFDFIDHRLLLRTTNGDVAAVPLVPQTVSVFYANVRAALRSVGVEVEINQTPNEVAEPIPFSEDDRHHSYDAAAAHRFWRALVQSSRVFNLFRTRFTGKCSPVHFFWGSFDLAVTRFSGRTAPPHPGGVPNLPDAVAREAYSHEVSSAGFWPGGGLIDYPAFYSYAYPEPPGYRGAPLRPEGAFFDSRMGEFILPYEVVRTADDPDTVLLDFLQATYEAAADQGAWDRPALEVPTGAFGRPRIV